MKPTPPTASVLTTAFYAFYDLHRPAYLAYAAARLPREEAQLSVTQLFDLIASNWTWITTRQCPSAWAWEEHTRAVARRTGRTPTPAEDTALLHDDLRLGIDRIATITGTDPARVIALLAAARRPPHLPTGRPHNRTRIGRWLGWPSFRSSTNNGAEIAATKRGVGVEYRYVSHTCSSSATTSRHPSLCPDCRQSGNEFRPTGGDCPGLCRTVSADRSPI